MEINDLFIIKGRKHKNNHASSQIITQKMRQDIEKARKTTAFLNKICPPIKLTVKIQRMHSPEALERLINKIIIEKGIKL